MGRFKNFSLWRGRLPHWRADNETYFVTFRHRRPLTETERMTLFRLVLRLHGKKLMLDAALVLAERTEIILRMKEGPDGDEYELSDVVEKCKIKAGKAIIKESGERWPPFWGESFDRIMRDEAELSERLEAMLAAPEAEEEPCEADLYPTFFLSPVTER